MGSSRAKAAVVVGNSAVRFRSRVSNGKSLFAEPVDQRLAWPRRMRDLLQEHVRDLGGEQMISAAERSIIRRIATISTELEILERRFALAETGASAADLDLYIRASGGLRRLLEAVGLKRGERVTRIITTQDLNDVALDATELEAEDDVE